VPVLRVGEQLWALVKLWERGGVRWLGTDEVVKTEVRHDRAAYPREPAVGAWTNEREGSSFIAAHCVGATWACARRERGR
jgi:hypothetical protein